MTAEHIGDRLAHLRRERGLTQEQLAERAEISVEVISRLEQRRKHGARTETWLRLARALDTSVGVLLDEPMLAGPAQTPPPSQTSNPQSHNERDTASADGGEEDEPTKRRDALGLGMAAVVTPELLGTVLRESSAEAMEFTRHAGESGVGAGTVDHLDAVVADLNRAYLTRPLGDVFVVARSYRKRVHELLQGPATLTERQQFYVHAAWLDEWLAWCAQDLGNRPAARAYAIDCFEHADQAGHPELCAYAACTLAEIATYTDQPRPDVALAASRRGLARAPKGHPLTVRLRAHTAKALAQQGDRDACVSLLSESEKTYDGLPATPVPLALDGGTLADYTTNAYPTTAYLWIGDFANAKRSAEIAISVWDSAHARQDATHTGAIVRFDLAHALVGLGAPGEAIAEARRALSSPLGLMHFVQAGAGEFDAALTRRYPDLPEARQFHEEYRALCDTP